MLNKSEEGSDDDGTVIGRNKADIEGCNEGGLCLIKGESRCCHALIYCRYAKAARQESSPGSPCHPLFISRHLITFIKPLLHPLYL